MSAELQEKVNEDRAKAGVWAWKCTNALFNFDIVPALERVESDTMIVNGEQDMDILRSKEEALKSHIKGSTLVIIPQAGHLPQVDSPDAFLEVVLPFLE